MRMRKLVSDSRSVRGLIRRMTQNMTEIAVRDGSASKNREINTKSLLAIRLTANVKLIRSFTLNFMVNCKLHCNPVVVILLQRVLL